MDVIIRGLDRNLHRRFKAQAALRGISLSNAIQEAMNVWLRADEEAVLPSEDEENNLAYDRMKTELMLKYHDKYVVFAGGRFIGAADSLEGAGKLARPTGAKKVVVTKMGAARPAGGEWLWSSLEL